MISFAQYTEMHFLRKQEALGINQIAQKITLLVDKTFLFENKVQHIRQRILLCL